jgi:hypothetical protein
MQAYVMMQLQIYMEFPEEIQKNNRQNGTDRSQNCQTAAFLYPGNARKTNSNI